MSLFNVDDLSATLENTRVSPTGVSFANRSLKLDTEDDSKQVVEEIDKCTNLQFLKLEGNTLGVDACRAIAKALEKHPELKRAQWKDMFTGRMKTEIPQALKYLGDGLVTAGARLTELDLSDNAFGPIGVEGLASLLRSSSCYALEELRLNNNGLGITGGKLLASALTDCYKSSTSEGKPLALKVFIAGRNRLENEGAKALAQFFKLIGTLEEVAMPQNGIYHVGISALSESFALNKNLQIINLNDNTIGKKGAQALANVLPELQNLKLINFGDCLLKTEGAKYLANGLKDGHVNLEELILESNEIREDGGLQLINAMTNKSKLKSLILDANQFGEEGRFKIKEKLKEIGKINTLGSLSEDESDDSDPDESDKETDTSKTDSEEEGEAEIEVVTEIKEAVSEQITVEIFFNTPSVQHFVALGDNRCELILKEAKKHDPIKIDRFIPMLMKVAALSTSTKTNVAEASLKCTEMLYKELFIWAQQVDKISVVNNTLLINLGLIKSEDKKDKPTWNLEGCIKSLDSIIKKNYVPESTKNTIKVFMQREVDNNGEFLEMKKQLLSNLA